jgi:hypothetical protein
MSRRAGDVVVVEADAGAIATALGGLVGAGVVDQDAANDARGQGEKVKPVLPVAVALIDQADIGLVNDRRRLQGVIAPLPAHVMGGEPAHVVVYRGHEGIDAFALAGRGGVE